jgi:uncharacterized membrane protein
MELWIIYALISMFFAGFTSVIAKQGLAGISGELGLTVRTLFVFCFVLLFAVFAVVPSEVRTLQGKNFIWLGLSGITTALSWVFITRLSNSVMFLPSPSLTKAALSWRFFSLGSCLKKSLRSSSSWVLG